MTQTDTRAHEDTPVDPAYRRLPTVGPHAPRVGAALITWVEPMPEHVVGYNRWYEDDHMITGAMVMPWMFSCRRFVAPRWLQHLRGPRGSRVAEPLEAGKYIGLYWINEGRLADHEQWALGANYRLHAEGRGSYRGAGADPLEERRHVFTAFHDYAGPVYRADAVPRDIHTMQHAYQGLVVELFDVAPGSDRAELTDRLLGTHLPPLTTGAVAVTLAFCPRPLPADKLAHVRELDGTAGVVTLLHFLECDPRDCWEERFATSDAALRDAGLGTQAMIAAFVPTVHGTNTYTDELF
jgi:hypothetical protein